MSPKYMHAVCSTVCRVTCPLTYVCIELWDTWMPSAIALDFTVSASRIACTAAHEIALLFGIKYLSRVKF